MQISQKYYVNMIQGAAVANDVKIFMGFQIENYPEHRIMVVQSRCGSHNSSGHHDFWWVLSGLS
jgi:hypothetical protein